MAVLFFLKFAIVLWVEGIDMVYGLANSTWWDGEGEMSSQNTHCNPHTRACL